MPNIKYNVISYFNFPFFTIILYFLALIRFIKSECNKTHPILLPNGICTIKYCTKSEIANNDCIISNSIIKTQWLTNIIKIGDLNFRYVNLVTFSTGDMIVETTSYPKNITRKFFGLQPNGLPYFGETNHYSIDATEPAGKDRERYEAEVFIGIINEGENKDKEYLASIPKSNQYAELFDFSSNKMHQKLTTEIFGSEIGNYRGGIVNYKLVNNQYYVLAFKTTLSNTDTFVFKRFKIKGLGFGPKQGFEVDKTTQFTINVGTSISCFVSDSQIIICSYYLVNKYDYMYTTYCNFFAHNALDLHLQELNTTTYGSTTGACYPYTSSYYNDNPNSFTKCIHLKEDVGVFVYYNLIYYYINNNNNNYNNYYNNYYNISYPILMFKRFNKDTKKFEDYLPNIELLGLTGISLSNYYNYSNNYDNTNYGNNNGGWGYNNGGWGNNNYGSNWGSYGSYKVYTAKSRF